MNRFFDRLASFTVQRRIVVVAFLCVITAIALAGHLAADRILAAFRPEEEASQPASSTRSANVTPLALSQADCVIVVQSKDVFTPEGTTALRDVVDQLEDLDQVQRIIWADRVPTLNIFGLSQPLLPNSNATRKRFEGARKKALEHPLVVGQLMSEDCETLLLMVTLNRYFAVTDEDATTLLKQTAVKAAAGHADVDLSFQVTGQIPTAIAAITAHESNQLKYQLIGYGMIGIMAVVLFRGIRAVMIVGLAPMLGVFWTLGIIKFFEFDQNPLIDVILPILISLVGLTDGVHLMVQIRKLRASGKAEGEAAQLGLSQVGMACFLTSLTTAIGFASLMLAESEWVQQFGQCAVVGVLMTFVSVVTVIPIACSSWLGRNVHLGQERSLIDQNLDRISIVIDSVLKRPTLWSVIGAAATVGLMLVSLTLTPDQRQSDELPQEAEATIALKHLDKAMGGLEFAEVQIAWNDAVDEQGPEILEVLTQIDDFLKNEELIGHPLSIRNLIDALPGSGPAAERMSMLELLPPPLKRAFIDPDDRSAKVTFRVQDLGIAAYGRVFERTDEFLKRLQNTHSNFRMELQGPAVWRWENLYQVVVDLGQSLGTASVIILIVLSIVYRSVWIGLISIVPNLFPLVFTGAYLAWAGYHLEIVMVCNFTICLGIAVDDTIHFLTRYEEEMQRTQDQNAAIRTAFTGVGTALIMTTTVLVAGFSTVMFSESRTHRIFATMGALTIAAALFADLVFLPALLSKYGKRKSQAVLDSVGSSAESTPS